MNRRALMIGASASLLMPRQASAQSFWAVPRIRACCSDADAVYADDFRPLAGGMIRVKVTGRGPRNHAWAPLGRVYIIKADKQVHEAGSYKDRPPHSLLFLNPANLDYVHCFVVGQLV
ncbi:MAG: hypothetical protein WC100_07035 [Sterolibacterium sp.]